MNERLKALRKNLNLSQRAFCEKIGVKQSTYAAFETGQRQIKEAYIKLICEIYNVNESWLKFGEGQMFNNADAIKSARVLSEIYNTAQELSEEEQLYILDMINMYKKRLGNRN